MKKLLLASTCLFGCGTEQASDLDIVGGQKVYRSYYGKAGGCGSTLIHKRWAISAKHCGNPTKAIFGLYRRNDPDNGGRPKDEVRITNIIKHPSWDLQLLKLERKVKFTPIRLHDGLLEDKQRLAAFGFGNTIGGESSAPEYLQGAVFFYDGDGAREGIIRASNRPNAAVCHGDSGGPLVADGKLVATVTFTEGKCSIYGSMGFTRLDYDWIRRHVK